MAILFLLGSTGAAQAACVSIPDTAARGFTQNSTVQALCLQQELAQAAARVAEKARLKSELETALALQRRELERQLAGRQAQRMRPR